MKAKPGNMAIAVEDARAPLCCMLTQGHERGSLHLVGCRFCEGGPPQWCKGRAQTLPWLPPDSVLPMPQAISEALWEAGGVGQAGPGQQLLLERYALLTVELQCAGRILCAVHWGINLAYWPAASAQPAIAGQQQEAASAATGRGLWSAVYIRLGMRLSHIPLGHWHSLPYSRWGLIHQQCPKADT